jgi:hypothetical protein
MTAVVAAARTQRTAAAASLGGGARAAVDDPTTAVTDPAACRVRRFASDETAAQPRVDARPGVICIAGIDLGVRHPHTSIGVHHSGIMAASTSCQVALAARSCKQDDGTKRNGARQHLPYTGLERKRAFHGILNRMGGRPTAQDYSRKNSR